MKQAHAKKLNRIQHQHNHVYGRNPRPRQSCWRQIIFSDLLLKMDGTFSHSAMNSTYHAHYTLHNECKKDKNMNFQHDKCEYCPHEYIIGAQCSLDDTSDGEKACEQECAHELELNASVILIINKHCYRICAQYSTNWAKVACCDLCCTNTLITEMYSCAHMCETQPSNFRCNFCYFVEERAEKKPEWIKSQTSATVYYMKN